MAQTKIGRLSELIALAREVEPLARKVTKSETNEIDWSFSQVVSSIGTIIKEEAEKAKLLPDEPAAKLALEEQLKLAQMQIAALKAQVESLIPIDSSELRSAQGQRSDEVQLTPEKRW
jgi:hypothetical protein